MEYWNVGRMGRWKSEEVEEEKKVKITGFQSVKKDFFLTFIIRINSH